MTEVYDLNPMPHVVTVRCPACDGMASFEFAEIVTIERREDIPFFDQSSQFEYRKFQDPGTGHYWHAAIYQAGLHGPAAGIRDLPAGYKPEQWAHSPFLRRADQTDRGAIHCPACGHRKAHVLDWPADAWYLISHRGQVLWAFNRDSVVQIRDFIASETREVKDHGWQHLLRKIPTLFKTRNNRDSVVKKLNKLLRATTQP